MPRLRNAQSGVVVEVSDETATRLGSEWEPADEPSAGRRPATKATAARKRVAPAATSTEE